MIKRFYILLMFTLLFSISCKKNTTGPVINGDWGWSKYFYGTGYDYFYSVQQTSDGGYIIVGREGSQNVWLVKTNVDGDTLWTKTYGGNGSDFGYSVRVTTDGGYIIAGETDSYGDANGDVYLIKTNNNGDTLWTKTYGGASFDKGESIQETNDGGYIIAGYTDSYGAGNHDVYIVKTDANGGMLWSHPYGGSNNDVGHSVDQTSDGGYIIVGSTHSYSTSYDVYLIKTNGSGDTLWTKTYSYSASSEDWGQSVQQTTDGGYIIAGYTDTYSGSGLDVYLIKTDSLGDTLWIEIYGGSSYERGFSVQQTTDGGYIITGETNSYGAGETDVWLIKTDGNGSVLWTETYGGETSAECGQEVQQTIDGGYIISGYSNSFRSSEYNGYIVKKY